MVPLFLTKYANVRAVRVFLRVAIDGEVFLAGKRFRFGRRDLGNAAIRSGHVLRLVDDRTIGVALGRAGLAVLIADDAGKLFRRLVLDAERHTDIGQHIERIRRLAAAIGVAIGHRDGGGNSGDLRSNAGRLRALGLLGRAGLSVHLVAFRDECRVAKTISVAFLSVVFVFVKW